MTKDAKDKLNDVKQELDLRFGGLLGELGSALTEALTRLDAGDGEVQHERTFQSPKGPIKASAGIRIRTLGGGSEFSTERAPDVPINESPRKENRSEATSEKETEPLDPVVRPLPVTVFSDDNNWSLIAEVPGIAAAGVTLTQDENACVVRAEGRGRVFAGDFDLPEGVSVSDLAVSVHNGILEITIKDKEDDQ